MKRVTTEQWVAFDGVPFTIEAGSPETAESACRAYERRLAHIRLVGLKIEDIEAALTRADPDLADAIELVGSRIARARLAEGEKRHERKPNGARDPAPATNGGAADDPQDLDQGRA